tara:strand:+ start:189 stop:440 length:252 start_codon:yes stop_codon:yes gene_type:complete
MVIKMTQRRDERVQFITNWLEENADDYCCECNATINAMQYGCNLYLQEEDDEIKGKFWTSIRSIGLTFAPDLPVWKKGWKPKK